MEQSQTPAGLLCPNCRADLVMSERRGVEIDYCPKCRGVWLDRGELDRIIEHAVAEARASATAAPVSFLSPGATEAAWPGQAARDPAPHDPSREYRRDDDDHHGQRNRRGSFLDRLFD